MNTSKPVVTVETAIETMKQMVEVAKMNNMTITDGHGDGTSSTTISGLAVHVSGSKVDIVAMFDATYYSINPVSMRDNNIRLSSWSCGGCFTNRGSLETAVREYNDSLTFGGGIIAYWNEEDGLITDVKLGEGNRKQA